MGRWYHPCAQTRGAATQPLSELGTQVPISYEVRQEQGRSRGSGIGTIFGREKGKVSKQKEEPVVRSEGERRGPCSLGTVGEGQRARAGFWGALGGLIRGPQEATEGV